MRRLLFLWLTLLAAYWAAGVVVSLAGAGRVDRSEPALFLLATVPAVQAVALGWTTRERTAKPHPDRRGAPAGRRWLAGLLAGDLAIAALAALLPEDLWFAPAGVLPAAWGAAQAFAAGVLATRLATRGARSVEERAWTSLLAAGLALAAAAPLLPSPEEGLLPGRPALLGGLAVVGPATAAAIALLLKLQGLWRRRSPAAAAWLDAAMALALFAGGIAVLELALRPSLLGPWDAAGKACSLGALTAILGGVTRAGAEAGFVEAAPAV